MGTKRIIQVEEKVPIRLLAPLSVQHMFAMFGASVLVPFLFGISPAIVLYSGDKGQGSGLSWLQLCFPCSGRDRDSELGL